MRFGFALALAALLPLSVAAQSKADPLQRPAEHLPRAAEAPLLDITAVEGGLIAAGARGHLLRSADGQVWRQLDSPLRVSFTRLRFRNARQGCAFGHEAAVLCTSDAGGHWQLRHYAPSDERPPVLHDARVLDDGSWLAVGAFGLMLRSRDDGASWQAVSNSLTELGYHFNALVLLGDGRLVVAGERGLLAVSNDRGSHWQLLASPYAGSFFGIEPLSDNGVLLYGQRGRVYAVRDLGRLKPGDPSALDPLASTGVGDADAAALGFERLPPVSSDSLFGSAPSRSGGWWLVGAEGAVVKVDAAARQLRLVSDRTANTYAAVVETPSTTLLVGSSGVHPLRLAGRAVPAATTTAR